MITYPYVTQEACTAFVAESAEKCGYLYGFYTTNEVINESQMVVIKPI
jgi:hypothetical protein